ncbi:MAG: hypothetical protein IJ920_04430 [Paludibacteraceae bacterium]|nr:hypothetical protein [Paludibacteraceae bacterium]
MPETKNKERGRGDGAGDDIARNIWTDAILSGRYYRPEKEESFYRASMCDA